MTQDSDRFRYGRQDDSEGPYVAQSASGALQPEPVAPRPRRSRRARSNVVKFFNFMLSLVVLAVAGFFAMVWYGKSSFEAPGPLQQQASIVVEKGATFSSLVPKLVEENIIPEQGGLKVFLRGVQAAGKAGSLKTGEFEFQPGMSMQQVMLQLTEGKPIQRRITFPEGWTTWQIVERLASHELLTGELPELPAEGELLPSTYDFERGASRVSLIERMKAEQQKLLDDIWANRATDLPLESPQELVTLASIVEKETGIGSERAKVAGVFINRLRKGMRLQSDPTIIYGIWGGQGKPKDRGGLRRSEIDRETPYNTYQINGLPPGPIANPGIDALRAVANPDETDALYFVADGTGGHVFAKSLDEHNANVRKWRRIEAERAKEAEAAAQSESGTENGN